MELTPAAIIKEFKKLANKEIATHSLRFFKSGPGEYGEGDQFLGIRVPVIRKFATKIKKLPLETTLELLHSPLHEVRFLALTQLVHLYSKGDEKQQELICQTYLAHSQYINNWDLVDTSCHKIVGPHYLNKDHDDLVKLAKSPLIWDRRIAVVSTYRFIKNGKLDTTFELAELLLSDTEDLMHKAIGWMLREAGKVDESLLESFLKKHHKVMPRTMLRYSLEKFPAAKRKLYMAK